MARTASGRHPETIAQLVLDEAHRRDAPRRLAVVRHPELVTGLPREVEVAARAHLDMGRRVWRLLGANRAVAWELKMHGRT